MALLPKPTVAPPRRATHDLGAGGAQAKCLFYELGILFVGVLLRKAFLFEFYGGAPDVWKLPNYQHSLKIDPNTL